jgi:hypothetical protein
MKWYQVFQFVLPLVAQFFPKIIPLVPYIQQGVTEAQAIAGASNADKLEHLTNVVKDGAAAISLTGTVTIDPNEAANVLNSAVSVVDSFHAILKANQAPAVVPAPTVPPAA